MSHDVPRPEQTVGAAVTRRCFPTGLTGGRASPLGRWRGLRIAAGKSIRLHALPVTTRTAAVPFGTPMRAGIGMSIDTRAKIILEGNS